MKTSFDVFTLTLRRRFEEATEKLQQRQASFASEDNLVNLGYTVRQRADDIMKESEVLRWMNSLVRAHENICLIAVEEGKDIVFAEHEAWWDDKFEHVRRHIASQCMSTIIRGVSTSSNPMYLIEEMMKVEAAKTIFGHFVSGYMDGFFDDDVLKDVFAGMKRREEEEDARRQTLVSKILVRKLAKSGGFFFNTVNSSGNELGRTMLYTASTHKRDAMAEANRWSTELRIEQQASDKYSPYITVEYI